MERQWQHTTRALTDDLQISTAMAGAMVSNKTRVAGLGVVRPRNPRLGAHAGGAGIHPLGGHRGSSWVAEALFVSKVSPR
jgi:hypothetical protein